MTPPSPICFLYTDSVSVQYSLSYLFSALLQIEVQTTQDPSPIKKAMRSDGPGSAVILHADQCSDELIDRISVLRERHADLTILSLHLVDCPYRTKAFLAGADDVIDWPCKLSELSARFFRRAGLPLDPLLTEPEAADWDRQVSIADRAGLTLAEAQILHLLLDRAGETVSRDALSMALEGRPWRYGDRKYDVHVASIRRKLADAFGEEMHVETQRSAGYRIVSYGAA
jgi:DNA-binding response OmpR family regulator